MTIFPCPHCGEIHLAEAKFCPKTGGAMPPIPSEQFTKSSDEIVCPHCGNIHAANAHFCPTTGQSLVPTIIAESLSASPSDSTIIASPSRQPLSRWLPFVGGGVIGLIVVAIGLMCLMGFATPIAIARIFISATPTPTITPSPTSTPTPTPTVTPSRTPTPTLTFTPSRTPTPLPNSTQTSSQDGMVSVYVSSGEFIRGSNIPSVTYRRRDAMPERRVYLDGFWIDQTEVTNGMYALCVRVNVCQQPNPTRSETRLSYYGNSQYNDFPVIYVTWDDAKKYCEWAGRRLPTEAEWEKAARGTDGRSYPWGNSYPYTNLLNFNFSVGDTSRVGQYSNGVSPYRIFDIAGNVWEWVADFYDENYYGNAPTQNPKGPASGNRRSFRGGGFGNTDIDEVRATYRGGTEPTARTPEIGFRCAK